MCQGVKEICVLPILLSNLSTTEICLMFIIEKHGDKFLYKSRNCVGGDDDESLCAKCKEIFDTLNHFHHLYLKQTCHEFAIKNAPPPKIEIETDEYFETDETFQTWSMSKLPPTLELTQKIVEEIDTSEKKFNDIDIPLEAFKNENEEKSLNLKPVIDDSMLNFESLEEEKMYICDDCGELLKDKITLESHMSKTHKKHICEDCGYLFHDMNTLQKHRSKTHKFKVECLNCGQKFRNKRELELHEKKEQRYKFDCQFCTDVEFKGLIYGKIKDHLIVSHLDEKENPEFIKIVRSDDENNICTICGAKFTTAKAFQSHKSRKHIDSSALRFSCDACGKRFRSETTLNVHKSNRHLEEPIPCQICGKILQNRYHLQNHLERQHTNDGGNCNSCGKYFKIKRHLVAHKKRVHLKLKGVVCSKCDKHLVNEHVLNKHFKIVHEGARPFGCEICAYKASKLSNLNLHRFKMHNIKKLKISDYIDYVKSGSHSSIGQDMIPLIKSIG